MGGTVEGAYKPGATVEGGYVAPQTNALGQGKGEGGNTQVDYTKEHGPVVSPPVQSVTPTNPSPIYDQYSNYHENGLPGGQGLVGIAPGIFNLMQ